MNGSMLALPDNLLPFTCTSKPIQDSPTALEETCGAEIYYYTTENIMASLKLVVTNSGH